MLVDKNARFSKRPVVLEPQVFFGQLQNIFVVVLKASSALKLVQNTTLILAAIRSCGDLRMKAENGIYYYSREGPLEVIDLNCVQCLVGRIKDDNGWAIVDRSGNSVRSVFVAEDDD
jgi:hypothetical protein